MSTVMEIHPLETDRAARPFYAIRWGAIFAGVVSGTATYLLLTLFGLAIGFTAVDPASAEPVGKIPLATGIWTGLSLLISAYIGGYVAGHMSSLSRTSDGMLHGFVSWGATTLLYAFIATSAFSAVLGGTFKVVGNVAQTSAQVAGGSANILSAIADGDINVNVETLRQIQQSIVAGDREQAVSIMVQDMNMAPDRANEVVDRVSTLLAQGGGEVRETAQRATNVLAGASWWLVAGIGLSLALGIAGGATGVRPNARRLKGDYLTERYVYGSSKAQR